MSGKASRHARRRSTIVRIAIAVAGEDRDGVDCRIPPCPLCATPVQRIECEAVVIYFTPTPSIQKILGYYLEPCGHAPAAMRLDNAGGNITVEFGAVQ